MINGGDLPAPRDYHPVISFDADGYYVGVYQELNGVPDDLIEEEEILGRPDSQVISYFSFFKLLISNTFH